MPLPPKTHEFVSQRFIALLSEADTVLRIMEQENAQQREGFRRSNMMVFSVLEVGETEFYALRTRFLTLIEYISGTNKNLQRIAEEVTSLKNTVDEMKKLKGYMRGLQQDFDAGLLDSVAMMIEAEVTADYMQQAEYLLGEAGSREFDHVPAAVLSGAVLEDALRRLCERQTTPIKLVKDNGQPKTLNTLIDDLKAVGLFNELKAKQLRAWADIRNAAAHGNFDQFSKTDVEQMLAGVQSFLADVL